MKIDVDEFLFPLVGSDLKDALEERFDPTVYLYTEAEQAPNPSSRVLLGSDRDALSKAATR